MLYTKVPKIVYQVTDGVLKNGLMQVMLANSGGFPNKYSEKCYSIITVVGMLGLALAFAQTAICFVWN
jgi:hypothetical protein